MLDAQTSEAEQNGVFDAKSGDRIDDPSTYTAVIVDDTPIFEEEVILSGQEDPETVAAVVTTKKAFTQAPGVVLKSSMVTVRVDADIENMTYGMINGEPNNFNFKEGLAYKIPLPVAEHLNDRGLVRQWISS
jgi:hypothetical protein